MVGGDVPAGLSLCRSAGWNQTAEDWELFLKLSPAGCCAAVDDDGRVRGTVATVRYEDRFSWIGMVLVDPEYQRRGIGIQLLREALRILSEEDTVKLDATPAGRHIYLQLDFVDEYRITRMEARQPMVAEAAGAGVRPVLTGDLPAIVEVDRRVFGAKRELVLKSVFNRGAHLAWMAEGDDGLLGYCLGREGYSFTHIGPVIARNVRTAKNLVAAALAKVAGRPIVIDCPGHSPDWITWLSTLGFREQRPLIRMYRGSNSFPGQPGSQFAILGPELG
jgi:ribosomal protein S18 acetylase RimI-like enzyme